jgi:hypothetical protein
MPTKHRVSPNPVSPNRVSPISTTAILLIAILFAVIALAKMATPNPYHAGSPYVTAAGVTSFGPDQGTYHDI